MSQPDQIDLTAEEKSYLQALIDAKKVPPRVSDRAKILLLRSDGVSPSEATYSIKERPIVSG